MPDQSKEPVPSLDQQLQQYQSYNTSARMNEFEPTPSAFRRSAPLRVHVPVHNASQWFNGPDMQNERSGRMEKVVSSLVRRSFRPLYDHAYVKSELRHYL